jgi:hypothetical protein
MRVFILCEYRLYSSNRGKSREVVGYRGISQQNQRFILRARRQRNNVKYRGYSSKSLILRT